MRYYLTQNLRIIIAAIAMFILSLSLGLLIYGHSQEELSRVSIITIPEISIPKEK